MKSINKNNLVKIAAVIIVLVALVSLVKGCFSHKGPMVVAGSEIGANEKFVYYNDKNNNVHKLGVYTEENIIFAEDCKLLDVNKNEVLVMNGYNLNVLDAETAEVLAEYDGISTDDAVLTEQYIYFKNSNENKLYRALRETGIVEIVPMMENIVVDNFDIYDDTDIVFSANTNRIVRYNPETLMMMTYAEEVNVGDFSANEGYLIYINNDDKHIVYSRDIDESSEVKFSDIKTNTVEYKGGKIFYLEDAGKNKDEYELMIFKGHSH